VASSGLSHLDQLEQLPDAVHLLSEQRRMHPDVCKVVSNYQYDGFLTTAKERVELKSTPFSRWKLKSWEASTVHSQQGSEADIVIFDTVNASSYNWPYEEWKRLVNVALSRAREAIVVLASRSEMDEPYLIRHKTQQPQQLWKAI